MPWKKVEAKLHWQCKKVEACAHMCICPHVGWCECVLGCFGMDPCISAFACLIGKKKRCHSKMCKKVQGGVWGACSRMEVRTGVSGAAGRPDMSELFKSQQNHPPEPVNIQFSTLSRLTLLFVQHSKKLLCCSINTNAKKLYCCCNFTSKLKLSYNSRFYWSIKFIYNFLS